MPTSLQTHKLVHMLDSLVRVTRRVIELRRLNSLDKASKSSTASNHAATHLR